MEGGGPAERVTTDSGMLECVEHYVWVGNFGIVEHYRDWCTSRQQAVDLGRASIYIYMYNIYIYV